jgi:hypothetical protein
MTMDAHTNHPHAATDLGTTGPQRGVELPAAVTISWSLAGGMLCGGAAVVLMILTGRMSGHLMLTASATLFAIGALAGLAHGIALGILGRPETMTVRESIAAMVHGLFYLVPALLLGWLVAGWVAAMPLAWTGKHFIAAAISALAWVAMIVTAYFAGSIGLRAAGLAFRRWPHRVAGSLLVGAVAATMVAAFVVQPPTIWFTNTRLAMPGALLLAFLASVWFYGPIITVGLWLVKRIRPELPEADAPSPAALTRVGTSAAIALVAGLLLAVIALPFYRGALGLPSDVERLGFAGAMMMALSQSLTDELFFRLFAMTVAYVLAVRLMPRSKHAVAIAAAIAVGAALDLIVHLRDLPALGLPGALAIGGYAVVRIVIPALAFGYLFWKRGLGTAVGAHLASGAALGLLAL